MADVEAMADMVILAIKSALAPVQARQTALQEQLTGFEARWADLGALRERVAVVEALSPIPVAPETRLAAPDEALVDLRAQLGLLETKAHTETVTSESRQAAIQARQTALQEQLTGFEARWADLGVLRERVAVVEVQGEALVDFRARLGLLETKVHAETVTSELAGVRERLAVLETRPQLQGPPGNDGEPGQPGKDGAAGLTYQGVFQDGKSYDVGELVTFGGSTWHANEATGTKPGDGSKAWTLIVKRGRDGKDGTPGTDGKPGRDLTKEDVVSWRS